MVKSNSDAVITTSLGSALFATQTYSKGNGVGYFLPDEGSGYAAAGA